MCPVGSHVTLHSKFTYTFLSSLFQSWGRWEILRLYLTLKKCTVLCNYRHIHFQSHRLVGCSLPRASNKGVRWRDILPCHFPVQISVKCVETCKNRCRFQSLLNIIWVTNKFSVLHLRRNVRLRFYLRWVRTSTEQDNLHPSEEIATKE
jgi:hypothetical protein